MQMDFLIETWRIGLGEAIMLSENNKEDRMQALMHLDRFLRKAYAEHEIPVILRRHSRILGCSILDFLLNNRSSARILRERLAMESERM